MVIEKLESVVLAAGPYGPVHAASCLHFQPHYVPCHTTLFPLCILFYTKLIQMSSETHILHPPHLHAPCTTSCKALHFLHVQKAAYLTPFLGMSSHCTRLSQDPSFTELPLSFLSLSEMRVSLYVAQTSLELTFPASISKVLVSHGAPPPVL